MKVILVAGTHGWRRAGQPAWYAPGSPFVAFLQAQGVDLVFTPEGSPFVWSTDLGGVGLGDGDHAVWASAGQNLFWYCVPPLCPEKRIPGEDLAIVTHSHGLQVALYAASLGLKIKALLDVCGPVRKDMRAVAERARPNISFWDHLYSDHTDRWQWIGELFDGQIGVVRKHPLADLNSEVPGAGHTGVLEKPELFHRWIDEDWIAPLLGLHDGA